MMEHKSLLELAQEDDATVAESGAPTRRSRKQPTRDGDSKTKQRVVIAVLAVATLAAGVVGVMQLRTLMDTGGADWPRVRVMNPQTGELAWYQVRPGGQIPEGFHPVEYCFAKECGPRGGTPVVLNVYQGKDEPTTCPVCGSTVVSHNPRPDQYADAVPSDWKK